MRSKMLLSQQIVRHTASNVFPNVNSLLWASPIFYPGLMIDFEYKIPFSDTLEYNFYCALYYI